jgi:cyclopropane-fatty-acyl-phospholipid synthase
MSQAAQLAINWVEQGLVPDTFVRAGIRRLCEQRLKEIASSDCETASQLIDRFVMSMEASDVAPLPHLANEQHYEVPAEFFALALGPHRKYSSAWWPDGTATLADAEAASLAATCEHAGLSDGQAILELGCGWGSLTLWMAGHYPNSRITAVSNSHSQRAWILAEAERRGLQNVDIITADMNSFAIEAPSSRNISTASFLSRCSSTCVTGARCLPGCKAGLNPAVASSCTSFAIARPPTLSSTRVHRTG